MKKKKELIFRNISEDKKDDFNIRMDIDELKKIIITSKYGKDEILQLQFEDDNGEIKKIPIEMGQLRSIVKKAELSIPFVPRGISKYLIDITYIYSRKNISSLVGREHEIEKVWFYLSQKKRNNVFLVGLADVGKTAIAREVIRQIANNECPKEFYDTRVLMFDAEMIQKISNKLKYQMLCKAIVNFVVKNREKIILYIDDSFDMVTDNTLSEIFYYLITKYNVPILTTSLAERINEYFLDVDSLSKYLNLILVQEPELNEIYPMIQNFIKNKEKEYGIKAPENVVRFGIYSSELSESLSANPGNVVNLFERAFLEAKRKEKQELDKESILSCYNSNLKLYNKMPEKEKRATAYHETGHYIAIIKSKHITNRKIAYVTILPMDWFMGLTSSYFTQTEEETPGIDWYLDAIAISMAGRIAEMRITDEYTVGAMGDLSQANQIAKSAILKYGLSDVYRNRYFENEDYLLLSEKKKEIIDEEIQRLIDEGYARAEKIISENEDLLKRIAEKLLKEEILTGQQLEEICTKAEKTVKKGGSKKKKNK